MDKSCRVEPVRRSSASTRAKPDRHALLAIAGMGCDNCVTRIRNELLRLEGVVEARVYLTMGAADVTFDSRIVSTRELVRSVRAAGGDGRHEYYAELIKVEEHPDNRS